MRLNLPTVFLVFAVLFHSTELSSQSGKVPANRGNFRPESGRRGYSGPASSQESRRNSERSIAPPNQRGHSGLSRESPRPSERPLELQRTSGQSAENGSPREHLPIRNASPPRFHSHPQRPHSPEIQHQSPRSSTGSNAAPNDYAWLLNSDHFSSDSESMSGSL